MAACKALPPSQRGGAGAPPQLRPCMRSAAVQPADHPCTSMRTAQRPQGHGPPTQPAGCNPPCGQGGRSAGWLLEVRLFYADGCVDGGSAAAACFIARGGRHVPRSCGRGAESGKPAVKWPAAAQNRLAPGMRHPGGARGQGGRPIGPAGPSAQQPHAGGRGRRQYPTPMAHACMRRRSQNSFLARAGTAHHANEAWERAL